MDPFEKQKFYEPGKIITGSTLSTCVACICLGISHETYQFHCETREGKISLLSKEPFRQNVPTAISCLGHMIYVRFLLETSHPVKEAVSFPTNCTWIFGVLNGT